MRAMLRRLVRTLPAGSAMLILAACGSTSTPTSPAEAVAATKAAETPTAGAAGPATSMTVRGTVVDSSNRLLANATIECLGDVVCAGPYRQVSAEGHGHQVTKTGADGSYEIVATSPSGSATGWLLMNANGRGYQVEWRQVEWPDPACTSDQARCAVTVNFSLTPVSD
jgi:protocatechuate 3,4-dioxygenase beta subunit